MALEDLVIGALPEDLQEDSGSLQAVWDDEYNPAATVRNLEEAQKLYPHKSWQRPLAEAAIRLRRRQLDRGDSGNFLLLEFMKEVTGETGGIPDAIEKVMPAAEEDVIFSSLDNTIEYLEMEWGDNARSMIAACAGVKPASVDRWLRGENMARSKYFRIHTGVLVYREAQNYISQTDAIEWLRSPEADGISPLERIGSYTRSLGTRCIPWELRQSLNGLHQT